MVRQRVFDVDKKNEGDGTRSKKKIGALKTNNALGRLYTLPNFIEVLEAGPSSDGVKFDPRRPWNTVSVAHADVDADHREFRIGCRLL